MTQTITLTIKVKYQVLVLVVITPHTLIVLDTLVPGGTDTADYHVTVMRRHK